MLTMVFAGNVSPCDVYAGVPVLMGLSKETRSVGHRNG